jgi:5-(carboxyamino)imidazole ribonucleotide synthase
VDDKDDLEVAVARLGLPAVLKTRRWGYDGKGQVVLRASGDLDGAWERIGAGKPLILERFVDFNRELSLVGVRGLDGEAAFYPLVENEHREGILRLTIAPAPVVSETLQGRAEEQARGLMESLEYVGVMALELFQQGEELLANELAPRVHNSGHWTQNGAWCSQFENHLRAVAGLPLGSTEARGQSAMLNLIGRIPDPDRLLGVDGTHLHLYGKSPRPGRKLGHVNVTGADPASVRARVERLEAVLDEHG